MRVLALISIAAAASLAGASLAAGGMCPAQAQLQNFSGAGSVVCPCFVAGEQAGAILRAPAEDYPIEILRVGIAWGSQFGGTGQSLEAAIHVYGDSLPDPGTPIFSLEGPLFTDGAINQFNLEPLPGEIRVESGPFMVALEFQNDNAGNIFAPSVVHDGNGCQSGRNTVKVAGGGWANACSLGVTGDWVMFAIYRACAAAAGVGDGPRLAVSAPIALMPARPNPFQRTTDLEFVLAQAGPATLSIFDAAGRRIARLAEGAYAAGAHRVAWDGRMTDGSRAPSGMYFAELRAGEHRARRSVLRTE